MTYVEQPTPPTPKYSGLEIAVIGMAGRFPGAQSIHEFWQNLQNSVESISQLEDEKLLAQGVSAEALTDPSYVKVGGVVEDIDLFDAAFFGFSPREAEILDPQQRLFLETAVEALETAGYDAERYPGSIGVYGGAGMNGYLLNLYSNSATRKSVSPYELFISNDKDFLTTRVSYKLNLRGPSVDVQTACSSSLVAVHMAAQALLSGECDMALAGGVAISKQLGYKAQAGSIYAPDGHCRAFDMNAAGTVSGNGVGIVVLKRLEDAIADQDTIDAVIKGSAINNDGALKVSYTAPCVEAQTSVIQAAHAMAEVSPSSISYVEAHGTGTALGDPIEIAALTQAFNAENNLQPQTCAIGSVKTNIGHLDAASGISGFIKAVLALKHKQIPANLHFQQPNPNIDFDNSPFYVNAQLSDWPQQEPARRAGVSSFGIGGTNAHVVLEEAPDNQPSQVKDFSRQPQLFVLSARTSTALDIASLNLADYLDRQKQDNSDFAIHSDSDFTSDSDIAEVAYTLQVGRKAFAYRRSVVCKSASEAVQKLHDQATTKAFEQPSTVFLFSGQGSQHINMAKGLSKTQPVFRQSLERCAEILSGEGIDLFALLYPETETNETSQQTLQQTANAQPALFAIEYALAQLWMSWGVKPTAMLGHSLGEYVAACLAGVFDLETALKLVQLRGQLMQKMPSGAMLSVGLSTDDIQPWLNEEITLSVSNGPALCVVSGREDSVDSLQARLEEETISCQRLHTSHAFHSPMMDEAIAPFTKAVSQALGQGQLHPPTLPFISNVTGTWITPEEATSSEYWGRHLRQTVRFSEGIQTLLQLNEPVFIEVGPGNTLTKLAKQHFNLSASSLAISSLPHPKSVEPDTTTLLSALGQLWSAGVEIDWQAFQGEHSHRRIPLPTYPFERQRYWVDLNGAVSEGRNSKSPGQSSVEIESIEIKPDIEDWFYTPSWERVQPVLKSPEVRERPCWLIFLDDDGIGKQLAKTIEKSGQDVFTVTSGDIFEQSGYRQFSLNPHQPEGFKQLIDDLFLREMAPTELVYLWTSGNDSSEASTDNFVVLMELLQAIASHTSGQKDTFDSLQLTIVTESAYEVTGTESLNLSQSQVQGLCQVIGQEYPTVGCRQVDWVKGEKTAKQLAHLLWQEAQTENPPAVVAYRGGKTSANWSRYRWAQTYQTIRLTDNKSANNQAKMQSPTDIKLREGGLYVIVGAQGIEKIWKEYLSEHYRANVVVIEETGADALIGKLKQTTEQFGSINGIFVCSPMTNEKSAAPVALLQTHHWEYNCQTKKAVLENLAVALQSSVLETHLPDFCCIQSSLSSIIGGLGLAAYASANHFIDSFVTQQNQNSPFPWFAINWDAYTEVEENGHNEQQQTHSTPAWGDTLLDLALTPIEVCLATERILTQAIPGQVIVSKGDLLARYQKWIHATPQADSRSQSLSQQEAQNGQSYSRPQLSTAYVAPRNEVEEKISAIWQDLLGLEKVGVDDSFFDLGGHSLLAIQVISRLREAFPVAVEMRNLLFEAPTVAKIAEVIQEQLPQETEMDEMAALLAEVQTLSTEEVQAQLAGGDA
ncbi:MAG: beta-ketoacyl synthase N-terminal-like domain-containing protein [Cyanobacteria bacterium J06632_3]